MTAQLYVVSGLEKVFADQRHQAYGRRLSMLKNDQLSYQLAFRMEAPECEMWGRMVKVAIESPLKKWAELAVVRSVPVQNAANDASDGNYLRTAPGLYPDLLEPLDSGDEVRLAPRCWHAFWLQIRSGEDTPAGEFPVAVTVSFQDGEETREYRSEVQVEVIDALLPDQKLIFTQWFHGDCLADYYHVEVFSEAHWALLRGQIAAAAKYGVNMLLTPVFTPPLDTAVGGERTTIQLVDVARRDGKYAFGFEKLGRWVKMCLECGIQYFEISHLYTQWGAKNCPKIMADDNGEYRRIFGWESDATGEEYRAFLAAFLPALTAELSRLGLRKDQVYFHVSDEPHGDQLAQYARCKEQIVPYLEGYPLMDALSDYDFYQKGACPLPVVATNAVTPFLENNVPDLWVYYCVSQGHRVSNRFMSMPSARNRVIGTQFYKYRIAGFLHWGFNFYNSQFSLGHLDPFAVTDAGGAFPSGDSFQVYPGPDGKPWDSIRIRVFYDAINDQRALELLESLTSREHVMELLEGGLAREITFFDYPQDAAYLLDLRSRVNREIAEALSRR